MKKTHLPILLLIIFILSSNLNAQQLFKIQSGIGGSGSTTTTVSESKDNTMLYIVGGAVIAGIVIYSVLKDKKEKPKDDSTKAVLNTDFLDKQLTLNDEYLKFRSEIPINISLGFQNDVIIKTQKRYFVGLAYKF